MAGLVLVFVLTGISERLFAEPESRPAPLSFVGSESCAGCHPGQAEIWRKSQHSHAMAHATETTVLGDFNDARFEHFGVHSRFFRQDNKFMVETEGPDGKLTTFEAKYTFGIDPLQQYLIEFPDGRDDVLHWTKLNQNWNFMCAE